MSCRTLIVAKTLSMDESTKITSDVHISLTVEFTQVQFRFNTIYNTG